MTKTSKYTVIIEKDEDGVYVAKVPDIPGCYTQAKSVPELIKRVKEAISVCLEAEQDDKYQPLQFVGVQQIEVKVSD